MDKGAKIIVAVSILALLGIIPFVIAKKPEPEVGGDIISTTFERVE